VPTERSVWTPHASVMLHLDFSTDGPGSTSLAFSAMSQTDLTAPTFQLLTWISERSRSYGETIEAWRTSCPRLAVWEDALADGLVRNVRGVVLLTAKGSELLSSRAGERAGASC
jgi:hypothetical protein